MPSGLVMEAAKTLVRFGDYHQVLSEHRGDKHGKCTKCKKNDLAQEWPCFMYEAAEAALNIDNIRVPGKRI